mmetsp:Transcript_21017/g.58217  ORF Transcript_21017/g.58217 Transcript_21017/m.58217 type:complete len:276 (+) Transcript_21017:1705-2532(+)
MRGPLARRHCASEASSTRTRATTTAACRSGSGPWRRSRAAPSPAWTSSPTSSSWTRSAGGSLRARWTGPAGRTATTLCSSHGTNSSQAASTRYPCASLDAGARKAACPSRSPSRRPWAPSTGCLIAHTSATPRRASRRPRAWRVCASVRPTSSAPSAQAFVRPAVQGAAWGATTAALALASAFAEWGTTATSAASAWSFATTSSAPARASATARWVTGRASSSAPTSRPRPSSIARAALRPHHLRRWPACRSSAIAAHRRQSQVSTPPRPLLLAR